MKQLLHSCSLAALLLTLSLPVNAKTVEVEENFDDDTHFVDGATLPRGWVNGSGAEFSRYKSGDRFGIPALSGDYILGAYMPTSGTYFCTPLVDGVAGTPMTMEFSYQLPGHSNYPDVRNIGLNIYAGPTQNPAEMTLIHTVERKSVKEWTKLKVDYTPEADGQYCFAIEVVNPNFDSFIGDAYFDDFFFTCDDGTGNTPGLADLEPDEANLADCVELPYAQNFSNADEYDGVSHLPLGWKNTGTTVWRTAAFDNLPAASGDYYMVSPESKAERDERAYTPFFNLEAGTEYVMTFYSHIDGLIIGGTNLNAKIHVTVGTQQDADFHTSPLLTIDRPLDTDPQWVAEEVRFTPLKSGAYCFCFLLEGAAYTGWVAVDNVLVTAPGLTPRPEPAMNTIGIYNFDEKTVLAFRDKPVRIKNTSKYAESSEWEIEGATFTELPDGSADVFFPTSGDYTVKLTVSNARGTRSTERIVKVQAVDADIDDLTLSSYHPEASTLYGRGSIPSFSGGKADAYGNDYISGFNCYYFSFGEVYDVPVGKFTIKSISTIVTNTRWMPTYSNADWDPEKKFGIYVYGLDEEGNVDESKLFGKKESVIKDVFGTTGVGSFWGDPIRFTFDEPVVTDGPFCIAMSFDENVAITITDPQIGRSFFSMAVGRKNNRHTTMYVKPYDVPEGSTATPDGSWYPVDRLDPAFEGMANSWQVWGSYGAATDGICLTPEGKAGFAAVFDGSMLLVSGTTAGETVALYDTEGRAVAMATAPGESTAIDCGALAPGLYIVATDAGSLKVVK